MNTLYLVCFVGLASLGLSLPTKQNIPESFSIKGKRTFAIKDDGDDFNHRNMTVATNTSWLSQLNITGVSRKNDPNDKLVIFYDVKQNFSLPGPTGVELHLQQLQNFDLYDKNRTFFVHKVRDGWTIRNGSVFMNVSLGYVGSILRDIDFSDFNKRSKVDYNVTFLSVVNITFPYDISIDQVHQEYPELDTVQKPVQMSLAEDPVFGLVPLVNSTGTDYSICKIKKCESSTKPTEDTSTFSLIDNISVMNSIVVNSDIFCYVTRPRNGISIYSRISEINLYYQVVIEET